MFYEIDNTDDDKKPNPQNNVIIQMILDLIAVINELGYEMYDIREILAEMKTNDELRIAVTNKFNAHRYPHNVLRFIMSSTYNVCPERFELQPEEQLILDLFERIQDQNTGCICISKNDLCSFLKFSQPQKRSLQKFLDSLTEKGFLEAIYRQPRGSRQPMVYRVNSQLSWIGNRNRIINSSDVVPIKITGFEQTLQQTYMQVVIDGKKYRCGTLSPILEKNEADATNTSPNEK